MSESTAGVLLTLAICGTLLAAIGQLTSCTIKVQQIESSAAEACAKAGGKYRHGVTGDDAGECEPAK